MRFTTRLGCEAYPIARQNANSVFSLDRWNGWSTLAERTSEPRTQRSGVSGEPTGFPLPPLRCVRGSVLGTACGKGLWCKNRLHRRYSLPDVDGSGHAAPVISAANRSSKGDSHVAEREGVVQGHASLSFRKVTALPHRATRI